MSHDAPGSSSRLTTRPRHSVRGSAECAVSTSSSDLPFHVRPGLQHSLSGSASSTGLGGRRDSSPSGAADPLGLQIVYSQAEDPAGDIVFVHGLGGSARKTWSWNRDNASFWPRWLAEDDLLSTFRVSTFGYNAKFKSSASNLDIIDFAKDLLFQLMTVLNAHGDHGRPIIFVAHSMGGLVVKKAYTLGKYDKKYSDVISNVRGIIFLATPHRGSQYAKILNNILSAIGTSRKAYVAGLGLQSAALQDINESFRKHGDDLLLFSFYETLKTSLSLTRVMIVEKDSAILGYPTEESLDMNADHRSICKYRDSLDPNYNKVKGVLATWARKILSDGELIRCPKCNLRILRDQILINPEPTLQERTDFDTAKRASQGHSIEDILGVINPDDDLGTRRLDSPRPGDWLFSKHDFRNWVQGGETDLTCRHFLLMGLPGTGKSVLSRSAIDYLKSLNHDVHYHFFNRTHQLKRTAVYCIRQLAFQLATCHMEFRVAILEMHRRTGISFNSQNNNFQSTWERLFEGILFQLHLKKPLFLVIDGIDESDAPSLLMSRIAAIQSKTSVRFFLTSRPLKGVPTKENFAIYFLQSSDTTSDMRGYVSKAVETALPGAKSVQNFVRDEILEKASGSFLWTRLVLEMLQESWHTEEDIVSALTQVPRGMSAMYNRMVDAIEEQGPRNCQLARQVLALMACSWRPLFVDELADALKPEFGVFINLELTITQICGHFVTVQQTESGRKDALLIHATAREFLLQGDEEITPWIDSKQAHEKMAQKCLTYLSDGRWRQDFGSLGSLRGHGADSCTDGHHASRLHAVSKDHPLLQYATCHWAFHLSKCPPDSFEIMETLKDFLLNHCLTWIEAVALSGNMIHLIRSARYLKAYARASRSDTQWIKLWATDFIRIASKFASNLVQSPPSVYQNIPPMCPKRSKIGETFGSRRIASLSVNGFPSETWDDCLASVVIDNDEFAGQVLASKSQFFILARSPGVVTIWDAETFEKTRALEHGEHVSKMVISRAGTLLATTAFSNSYVWDTASGNLLHRIPKSYYAIVRDLAFSPGEAKVLIAYDNCVLESVDLQSGRLSQTVAHLSQLEADYQGCPWREAISPDVTKVAMAWRGHPPLIWDLRSGQDSPPLKCRTRGPTDSLFYPEQLLWRPETGSLLILCADTNLFEWRVFIDDLLEYPHVKARDMAISSDGNLLLSSDHDGTLSVWTFPRLNLIYRLTNHGDPVTDVAFSSDNQRIYDIRYSGCNVWEPDALVRSDDYDMEETSSATGSMAMTEPTISSTASTNAMITAMSIGPDDKCFACGREDGSVIIHDAFEGNRVRKVFTHPAASAVVMISWSKSGKYLASCDESALVVVKRLQPKEDGKFAVFGVMESRSAEPVRQLVFSPDEGMLLISTSLKDRVLDLKGKTELYTISRASQQHRRYWVSHPQAPSCLLWLEENMAEAYDWATGSSNHDLQGDEVPRAKEQVEDSPNSCHCRSIVWSSPVDGGRHQVVAVSEGRHDFHGTADIQLVYLDAEGNCGNAASWRKLPLNFDGKVRLILGTIGNDLVLLGLLLRRDVATPSRGPHTRHSDGTGSSKTLLPSQRLVKYGHFTHGGCEWRGDIVLPQAGGCGDCEEWAEVLKSLKID
ncbi:NACHT and WD domain-containing protein [Tolypocladium paradoxum]|uniref:NACHT and WD domain-containing protein n=1 Tax=Tolypocladium paradoxum TaxID=94208 RepID=A0A2S4KQJ9_9HYPO|nr:NACHT and WD domain-containing protein [Tolypocladium paradoxum]